VESGETESLFMHSTLERVVLLIPMGSRVKEGAQMMGGREKLRECEGE